MKSLLLLLSLLLFTFSQTCSNTNQATSIIFSSPSKHGTKLNELGCNPQTNIDFTFGQGASGYLSTKAKTTENYIEFDGTNGNSKLQFLDLNGNNRSYELNGITLAPIANARIDAADFPTLKTHELSLKYKYTGNGVAQDTILVVYLYASNSVDYNTTGTRSMVSSTALVPSGVQTFRSLVKKVSELTSSGNAGIIENLAGAMAPFRSMDYGKFYTVQTTDGACKTNYLISSFVYNIATSDINTTAPTSGFTSQSSNQALTGDFLCYGSHVTGLFQTHMRQSYPLWAAWFGSLIFWCAILFAENTTPISLYDRKFQQNKWTSWEMYSLFHLAHQQYFTRMLRTVSVYVCFTVSCVVNACLYGELGVANPDPITILWMGAIGGVAGWIFSFPLGFFLQGFYAWTLTKYNLKKKIKDLQDKQNMQAQSFDRQVDECDDKIYTYYYWYYVLSLAVLFVCWAISVNEMQKLPRENYYQMWYWVGSIGVSFVLNVFVLSVIATAVAGNTRFYQSRGFWYDYQLGQVYKEIQD